jgi:hypothetical protein
MTTIHQSQFIEKYSFILVSSNASFACTENNRKRKNKELKRAENNTKSMYPPSLVFRLKVWNFQASASFFSS